MGALHKAELNLPESGVSLYNSHDCDIDEDNDAKKIAVIPANLFLHLIIFDHKVDLVIRDKQKGIRVCKDEVGARHDEVLIGQVQTVHPWDVVGLEVPDVNHLETAAQAQDLDLGPRLIGHKDNQGCDNKPAQCKQHIKESGRYIVCTHVFDQ